MTNDTTQPDWTPRIIAAFAVILALVGVASFVGGAVRTGPAVSVTTTCAQFAADAEKSFNGAGNVTLSGPFTPGDHVHLAIDFKGVGYSWQATGVLGAAKTDVTGSGWFETDTTFTTTESGPPKSRIHTSFGAAARASGTSISGEAPTPRYDKSTTVGQTHGDIDGITRLNVDVEVATPGDGAITISQRGSLLLAVSQKVAIANCTSAKQTPVLDRPTGDVSSNGSTRGMSAPLG
jgi:hypothetical protein